MNLLCLLADLEADFFDRGATFMDKETIDTVNELLKAGANPDAGHNKVGVLLGGVAWWCR